MSDTSSRLGGSGRTILMFGGPDGHIPISYARTMTEDPPRLVADHEFIQPLDWPVPSEVMTAQAIGGGTIDIGLIENWSQQAWNRLGGALGDLGGSASNTILDIVRAVSNTEGALYITKIIATPQYSTELLGGGSPQRRATYYMNAKIVRVDDGDTDIAIDTMSITKTIQIAYTHRLFQRLGASGAGPTTQGLPGTIPSGAAGAMSRSPQLQSPV